MYGTQGAQRGNAKGLDAGLHTGSDETIKSMPHDGVGEPFFAIKKLVWGETQLQAQNIFFWLALRHGLLYILEGRGPGIEHASPILECEIREDVEFIQVSGKRNCSFI